MNGNAQKATEGQKLEIISAILKASPRILKNIARNLSHETAKKWIGDQKGLERVLIEAGRKALMLAQINNERNKNFPIWRTICIGGEEVDLAIVSNDDLGFKNGAYAKDTYKRALELGLKLYPIEKDGEFRQLRKELSLGDDYWIIAINSDGDLYVFNVERSDDGSWLNGVSGRPDDGRSADVRFVFALPRK